MPAPESYTTKLTIEQKRAQAHRASLIPLLKELDSGVYHYPLELKSAGDLRSAIRSTLAEMADHDGACK